MSGLDDMPLEGWYAAISAALHAHDMKAAAGLIALMAVHGYPREAEELRAGIVALS